jgi:hypothetical protein
MYSVSHILLAIPGKLAIENNVTFVFINQTENK